MRSNKANTFLVLFFVLNFTTFGQEIVDITDLGGIITSQFDGVEGYGVDKLVDNLKNTRFLSYNSALWVQYQALGKYTLSSYTITSANNSPDRDPLSWKLLGSNDESSWITLDTRTNEDFPERMMTRSFDITNATAYMYYRLDMVNNSGTILHFAEWELLGISADAEATELPLSPTGLESSAISSSSIMLTWNDNSGNESVFRLDISKDNIDWLPVSVIEKDAVNYTLENLDVNTKYFFRIAASNSKGLSEFSNVDSAFTLAAESWKEHWFEHNQTVTRVYYDDDLVVYYDKDMNTNITWPFQYLGDVWRYTKEVYGEFGIDPKLFAIFHAGKYSGGHPFYHYDSDHDYHNGIDCGAASMSAWSNGTGNDLDLTTHEISHIVESATFGTQGSPAFGSAIWGDSKWAEIFIYDVYAGMGRVNDAQRWYNLVNNQSNSQPKAGTYWFKNWFYPIWRDYGNSQVLVNYFRLMAEYFPKNGPAFSRDINWGEFFHFFSGAAGVSLRDQAEKAFGWNDTFESQFQKAKTDFPGVTYTATGVEDESSSLPEDFGLLQNYPNPFNPETTIGFNLPAASHVVINVYNVIGQKVTTITNEFMQAGKHNITWNGKNDSGNNCPSGIYFYKLESSNYHAAKSMVLVR